MTLAERAILATHARQQKAARRRAMLLSAIAGGSMVKQAAHAAGVSQRTATRYLSGAR